MGRELLEEVLRLAVGAGLPLAVTLVLLVVAAVLMVLGRRFGGITWPKGESGGPPNPDGAGGDGGPGGPGVALPTDPSSSGGGPTGGMG